MLAMVSGDRVPPGAKLDTKTLKPAGTQPGWSDLELRCVALQLGLAQHQDAGLLASACTFATASLGPGASGASASSEPRPKKRRIMAMAGPKSQRAKEVESLEELQRQSRQHLWQHL